VFIWAHSGFAIKDCTSQNENELICLTPKRYICEQPDVEPEIRRLSSDTQNPNRILQFGINTEKNNETEEEGNSFVNVSDNEAEDDDLEENSEDRKNKLKEAN